MGPLVLVGFVSLWAGLGLAEVVDNFSTCKDYFYEGKEPEGFDIKNRVKICQRYKNNYCFATFYDKQNRIPVWSAYTMDEKKCQEDIKEEAKIKDTKKENKPESKKQQWMVEAQLSGLPVPEMKMLGELNKMEKNETFKRILMGKKVKDKLKESQALNEDYENTGYDRGHLNPNCFHYGVGQTATCTLTNAVPMDPCFNRVHWYDLEENLKKQLKANCSGDWNPLLVTGAVPNAKYKIPHGNVGRVVVPSHIWTAVCCNHTDNNKKYSFAFLGKNRPGSTLESMKVTDLNNRLKSLYNNPLIEIFQDDCNEDSPEATKMREEITNQLHSSFPNWDGDEEGPPGEKRPRSSVG